MTNPSPLVELNASDRARRANGLLGTRALVDDLRFQSLCDLLVETRAVPRQALAGMFVELADRLDEIGQARRHPDYLVCPDECAFQAHQHRERATDIGDAQSSRRESR